MNLPVNAPPYLHWHAACPACSRMLFVKAVVPPGPIGYPSTPPEATCPHCGHCQRYEPTELLLHSGQGTLFSPPGPTVPTVAIPSNAGALAVVAGMVAAIRLAKEDTAELAAGSARVRSIIADSTRVVAAEVKRGQT